ncbi:MAG: carboxylesterase family protein [Flavobacteriales bacterium]|nr:carboxylesterase family protein [Flavobacteriales bacterium]
MDRHWFVLFLLSFAPLPIWSQDYVTPDQFAFTVDTDLVYGADTNYLGSVDTLRLDLYKPIGNSDPRRPLLVMVHGGSWLGGCKNDPAGIVPMLQQFVKRGYVVASVNYRLGWHKDDFVPGPVAGFGITPWPEAYRSFYALDSAEIKRAIFRGMQDVKGAIRWLKARAQQDSTCVDKVMVGGESAGAFIALATAFLNAPSEKPTACAALPDAPSPYGQVLNATAFECDYQAFPVDPGMLVRPDLGPVEGVLNMNGYDASVRGVASFYGGVPWEAFDLDWLQGPDTPAVYLYHQTCDGVVMHGKGKPMSTLSANCNLGAYPWHYNYPDMYGSGAIKASFDAMIAPPEHTTDFEFCVPFDPNLSLIECPRYANNGSYHFTNDHALRATHLATFLEPLASDPGSCLNTSLRNGPKDTPPRLFPQPANEVVFLTVPSPVQKVSFVDGQGRPCKEVLSPASGIDVHDLPSGPYLIMVTMGSEVRSVPCMIAH